jgi:predicted permease
MDVRMDLGYAVRTLRRSPGFTAAALLSLVLGIGANTAIFTLIDHLLLRSLPVREPARLAMLSNPDQRGIGSRYCYQNYVGLRDRNTVFSGLLARLPDEFPLDTGGRIEPVPGEWVSGNYFSVLEVNAHIGRTLTAEDDRPPGNPVAMLSYGYWRRRFGADPAVVGKTIRVHGQPLTIVGVTPPEFSGVGVGYSPAILVPWAVAPLLRPLVNDWNPLDDPSWNLTHYHSGFLHLLGRLKPGISFQQAERSLQPLYRQIIAEEAAVLNWDSTRDSRTEADRRRFLARGIAVSPGGRGFSGLRQRHSQTLLVLMALVGLVLLITCSTVANLLLARAAARRREIAIRLAIGAGCMRVLRQMLVESLLLAGCGGALAVLAAWWGAGALVSALPGYAAFPPIDVTPDPRILGFTLGVSLIMGLLFGLAPAFQALRLRVSETLKDEGGAVTGSGSQMALRKSLIVAQVALSVLLLAGAGLFVQTLRGLKNVETGMDRPHLIHVAVALEPWTQFTREQTRQFHRVLLPRLEALPGVRSAACSMIQLLSNESRPWTIRIERYTPPPGEALRVSSNVVTSRFFDTVGIPVVAGRVWGAADDFRPAQLAVVNEAFARYFFGDKSPLGQTVSTWAPGKFEIIGVVKDSRYRNLREDAPRSIYYSPDKFWVQHVYLRTVGDPAGMIAAVRREIEELNRNAHINAIRTLDDQVDELLVNERLVAWLASFFGLLAALLAAIGVYGVIAFSVVRRTREIGIRVALGAGRAQVLWLVIREVLLLAAGGVALGLSAALALSRLAGSLLFGVTPTDAPAMAGAALLMGAVAMLAGYLPARRATQVDPMVALRFE